MARKQEFRLEQVLDLRRRAEEQQQLALHARIEEEARLRAELDDLVARREARIASLTAQRRRGPVDPKMLEATLNYVESVEIAIQQQNAEITAAQGRVEGQREALVAAMRDRQALEQLRDQHNAAAHRETDRREAKEVDDIVSARFARRGGRHGSES
jgi:flagellar export protein FliJ